MNDHTRNPNIAILTIGSTKYAIPDTQCALEVMAALSKAIQLDDYLYSVRDYTNAKYALSGDQSLPELKFVAIRDIDGQHTVEEIKTRGEREKKDREDMEAGVKVVPTPLDLPAPELKVAPGPDDDIPF